VAASPPASYSDTITSIKNISLLRQLARPVLLQELQNLRLMFSAR